MFLFILFACPFSNKCVNIQIHLMFLFIRRKQKQTGWLEQNSNTSHVLIYRILWNWSRTIFVIQIHLMFLFIKYFKNGDSIMKYSNTSHVLIYQLKVITMIQAEYNSNTSHVLIYPYLLGINSRDGQIQIHLMFLFIRVLKQLLQMFADIIQIHLMFLFIFSNVFLYTHTIYIQIHLMFLFIGTHL